MSQYIFRLTARVRALTVPEDKWKIRLVCPRLLTIVPLTRTNLLAIKLLKQRYRKTPQLLYHYVKSARLLVPTQELIDEIACQEFDHSDNPVWLPEIAKAYYALGQTRSGDAALEQAKLLDPGNPRIFEEEAWNQRSRENIDRERSAVEHLISLHSPESGQLGYWLRWRAIISYKQSDFSEAAEYFKEAGPSSKFDFTDSIRALHTFLYLNDAVNLEKWSQVVLQYQESKDPLGFPWTRRLMNVNEFEAAAVVLAADIEPSGQDCERLWLESRLAWLRGEWQEALERALSYVSTATAPSLKRLRSIASIAELLDKPEAALSVLDAGANRPEVRNDRGYLFQRARVVRSSGKSTEAASIYKILAESVLAAKKPSKTTVNVFGKKLTAKQALKQSLAKPSRVSQVNALSTLRDSVSSFRDLQVVSAHLGLALLALERVDNALEVFKDLSYFRLPNPGATSSEPKFPRLTRELRYSEFVDSTKVDPNLVAYESFHGRSTSCSPLALCLEALSNPSLANLRHVWIVEDGAPLDDRLLADERVTFVQRNSYNVGRVLSQAGVLINNTSFEPYIYRRPEQKYLNTWHGIPWKHLGRKVKDDTAGYGNIARNFLQATHIITPDPHTRKVLTEDFAIDQIITADILETGYPRADLTLNLTDARRQELRNKLNLNESENLLFYAPTWRGTTGNADVQGAISETLEAYELLASTEYTVVMRAHYFVENAIRNDPRFKAVRVADSEIDTNEILAIADILVSDFSSVIFDFAVTDKPIVKYVPDYSEYEETRGLYFSADEVPGDTCYSAKKLVELVNQYASKHASISPEELSVRGKFTPYGIANASTACWTMLLSDSSTVNIKPRSNEVNLFSVGGLNPNGITRSLLNLVQELTESGRRPVVSIPSSRVFENSEVETRTVLSSYADILPRAGARAGTLLEREVQRSLRSRTFVPTSWTRRVLKVNSKRELKRLFGDSRFKNAIEFDGYVPYDTAMLALQDRFISDRTIQFLHSDYASEIQLKYPWLSGAAYLLAKFDTIASVSEPVKLANAAHLRDKYRVSPELHFTLQNLIQPNRILTLSETQLSKDLKEWFSSHPYNMICVGRLSVEKNQALLIQVLKRSRIELPNLQLGLVGSGTLQAELRAQAQAAGVADRVTFFGHQSNPYPIIKAANLIVAPSKHEGQGIALLEALVLQKEIIASDIPPFRSILDDGKLGVTAPTTTSDFSRAIINHFNSIKPPRHEKFDFNRYEYTTFQGALRLLDEDSEH